jgi:mercuric ion transport protein
MIPLIIVMPLAVAGGGLLGLAKNRFRRKRLSKAILATANSDMAEEAVQESHSVIVASVTAGASFLIVTGKGFINKIYVQLKRTGDKILLIFTRIGDKSGAFGGVIAAMGCAVCFPALASLGAAIGLGFLTQWEDLFMTTLIPLFAWIALLANALGWFSHRQWHRSLIGMAGPTLILLSLYPWFMYPWFKVTLFTGLFLMVAVAIWDLTSPAHRRCEVSTCDKLEA